LVLNGKNIRIMYRDGCHRLKAIIQRIGGKGTRYVPYKLKPSFLYSNCRVRIAYLFLPPPYEAFMSNYRRNYIKGGSYFFTVVTEKRRPILNNPLARQCLREAFRHCMQNQPFSIDTT
jgi:hypothetical protein